MFPLVGFNSLLRSRIRSSSSTTTTASTIRTSTDTDNSHHETTTTSDNTNNHNTNDRSHPMHHRDSHHHEEMKLLDNHHGDSSSLLFVDETTIHNRSKSHNDNTTATTNTATNNIDSNNLTLRIKATTTMSSSSSTPSSGVVGNSTSTSTTTMDPVKQSLPPSSSSHDVSVTVQVQDTVAAVKHAVLQALFSSTTSSDDCLDKKQQNTNYHFSYQNQNQPLQSQQSPPPPMYVRLIASGRLLAPDTATLNEFDQQLKHGNVIHAVIVAADQIQKRGAQAFLQQSSQSNVNSITQQQQPKLDHNNQQHQPQPQSSSYPLFGSISSGRPGPTSAIMTSMSSRQRQQRRRDMLLRGTGVNESGWAVRRDPNDNETTDDDEDDDDYDEEDDFEEDMLNIDHADGDLPNPSGGNNNNNTDEVIDLELGQTIHQQQQQRIGRLNSRIGSVGGTTGIRSRNNNNRYSYHHRGFDALRDTSGLRRVDIMTIRNYFNHQIDLYLQNHPQIVEITNEQEPYDVLLRRRYQEEAWMLAQGPHSEFRLNLSNQHVGNTSSSGGASGTTTTTGTMDPLQQQPFYRSSTSNGTNNNNNTTLISTTIGTDRDFVLGFFFGFFVGFFMLVWVWMPNVPHKQKLGILTGYSCQLTIGMWNKASSSSSNNGMNHHNNNNENILFQPQLQQHHHHQQQNQFLNNMNRMSMNHETPLSYLLSSGNTNTNNNNHMNPSNSHLSNPNSQNQQQQEQLELQKVYDTMGGVLIDSSFDHTNLLLFGE